MLPRSCGRHPLPTAAREVEGTPSRWTTLRWARRARMATMADPDDELTDGPADAISWLLLGCMAAAVVAGLFLLLRVP